MTRDPAVERVLRELAPRVLGALVRRYGQFDASEDAVQEALIAASMQWPEQGVPEEPMPWLFAVARRKLVDHWRSESARKRREESFASLEPPGAEIIDEDDTLPLLFLCCHPSLSATSQLALTLRAVGGLTTAEIASALLVPEATMAQRISRAKQTIRAAGAVFGEPPVLERDDRLRVVMHVLYLIFNEGYTATSGPALQRAELSAEAIRLARKLCATVPANSEAAGLLALMLLTDARRLARTLADGSLVALADQDRSRWDAGQIAEGTAIVSRTLGTTTTGPYLVQAAIAALHDEAASEADTDWEQILALYSVLEHLSPGPVVTLNRAVALAMVRGPLAGLDLLKTLDGDERMQRNHRLDAVRAHLLERAGEHAAAREAYLRAAKASPSVPEQRYLAQRASRLAS